MKNLTKRVIFIFLTITLFACQAPSIDKKVASEIAQNYINALNTNNYEEAFKYVNEEEFFAARSKDRWIEYFTAISKEMGSVISVKLSRQSADDRFSGRFYTYQFSIKHENGFTKNIITMIQEINTDVDLKIFAHRIEGGKLLKINDMY